MKRAYLQFCLRVAVGSVVAQSPVLNMLHVKPKRLQHSSLSHGSRVQVLDAFNYDLIVQPFNLMVAWLWSTVKNKNRSRMLLNIKFMKFCGVDFYDCRSLYKIIFLSCKLTVSGSHCLRS